MISRKKIFLKVIPFIFAFTVTILACGYSGPLEKRYDVWIVSPDKNVRNEIKACIANINQSTNKTMITVAGEAPNKNDLSDDQSRIEIIPGIQLKDNSGKANIGQAQFLIHSSQRSTTFILRFDYASWIKHKATNGDFLSKYNMRTCAHEYGHAVGLGHSSSPTDVMHDFITSRYDTNTWQRFYENVQKAYNLRPDEVSL